MTDEVLAQSENEQIDNIEFEQNCIEQGTKFSNSANSSFHCSQFEIWSGHRAYRDVGAWLYHVLFVTSKCLVAL